LVPAWGNICHRSADQQDFSTPSSFEMTGQVIEV
jgi:hypothetical protein